MSETLACRLEHLATGLDFSLDFSSPVENTSLLPVAYRPMVWRMKLPQCPGSDESPQNKTIKIKNRNSCIKNILKLVMDIYTTTL